MIHQKDGGQVGQTISHYKILEKLGEGGMGVVYKAEDTRLRRTVALKMLPRGLESHEMEQARFLQEAQAASILNHQNICSIHTLIEHEGQQIIDMEYVDGVTLRKKIQDGMLKLQEIITYAVQVGEALEEAHSHSIVHRDVKPENIMVNSKNQIKVMDFGLAKLKGSLKLTKTSSTVGTLAYMSPEQIQGGQTDARSDIFSFGIVLYEMLSGGHVPFRGEHEAALVYSIVNEEPIPIQQYRPEVSSELLHILNRSLEKDVEERYQTVHDMLIDLRRLRKETTRVVRGTPSAPVPAEGIPEEKAIPQRSYRKKTVLIFATAVLLLGVVCIFYFIFFTSRVRINPDYSQQTLRLPFKTIGFPCISPDGNWIVFKAIDKNDRYDLYVMSAMGGEPPRRLTFDSLATGADESAFISPDGKFISYTRGIGNEICIVPFIGGTSRKIGEGVTPKWSPLGDRIGYMLFPRGIEPYSRSGKGEFWTMNPDGTDKRLEFIDSSGESTLPGFIIFSFAWSPSGNEVAWVHRLENMICEIFIHNLKSGQKKIVTADSTYKEEIWWLRNGQLVYASGSQQELWTVPATGGQSVPITKGGIYLDAPTASDDCRRLICWQRIWTGRLWRQNLDGTNRSLMTSEEALYYTRSRISPDGYKLAVCTEPTGAASPVITIIDLKNETRRQVTGPSIRSSNPVWSPDGRWLAYSSRKRIELYDSIKTYVIDAEKLDVPRCIQLGWPDAWLDTVTLQIRDVKHARWAVHLDGGLPERIAKDSILPFQVGGGDYIFYRDYHKGREGNYLIQKSEWDGGESDRAKEILPRGLVFQDIAFSGSFGVFLKDQTELWRVAFPDGRSVRLPITLPPVVFGASNWVSLSWDGNEIIYPTHESADKIVVIDDLFK